MAKQKYNKIVDDIISPVWYCVDDEMFYSYKVLKDISEEYEGELEEEQKMIKIGYKYEWGGRCEEMDVYSDEILEETYLYHGSIENAIKRLPDFLDEDEQMEVFKKLLPYFKRL